MIRVALERRLDRPLRWLGVPAAVAGIALFELASHASTFTERDSVNLARALRHFDVRLHQPHPPGYPLVVLTAHGLHWLGSSLTAYLAFDLLASIAAVVATYHLARAMFGRRAGTIAAALLLATPLFLYYAAIVSVYPGEEAFAPIVALLAYRTATSPAASRSAFLLLPTLAVGAGFRPTMLGLMLPVCLVALYLARPPRAVTMAAVVLAAAVAAAWAVPMLVRSGGVHGYLHASSRLYGSAASGTSLLHGATLREAADNVWLVAAGTLLVAVPSLLLVVSCSRRLRVARRDRVAYLLLGVWLAPYLGLYSVAHFGKPGYVLAYLPALTTAAAGFGARARAGVPVGVGLAAIGVVLFLTAGHLPLPDALARRDLSPFVPTAAVIALQDHETRTLERLSRTCSAANCTIVSFPGTRLAWDHSPAEVAREYAQGSRVVSFYGDPEAVASIHGTVLWLGSRIPRPVIQLAREVPGAGSWRCLRSDAATTRRILDQLGMPARPGGTQG